MGLVKKVIILHGWTYSTEKYVELNNLLKEKRLTTVMLKIPGLTETLKEDKVWTIDDYVNWLEEKLNKEKDKIILIGHSNGGRISLNFTIKHPEKVEKLILIDSAGIYHNDLYIRMKRLFFATLAKVGKKITKSEILRSFLYKLTKENDYKNASLNMRKTMVNLMKSDMLLKLNEINVPTLIIWGENDTMLPLKDGKKMRELIKNSKLYTVKGARHAPQFTHAKEVAEIIMK